LVCDSAGRLRSIANGASFQAGALEAEGIVLITGEEKLERMRDGRAVYIGSEKVADVTRHPAFRGAAQTIAALYEFKRQPSLNDTLSFEENGERFSIYFLRAKTREDLARRTKAHKIIADFTFGLMGRTPDHVASVITGLATNLSVFDSGGRAQNLLNYYEEARRLDYYIVFACVPPTGARNGEVIADRGPVYPALRVVGEYDGGVILSGIKMLATGAVFADEIWIGNLLPLDEKFKSEAITCAIPVSAKGASLWARQPTEDKIKRQADYPLSYRFDETDSMLVCDRVRVPWERVFLHNDTAMSRGMYIATASNCYANHQSNVRFWSKMALLVGIASRVARTNGIDKIPAVRETLGRLAALEATIAALVAGQIECFENWPTGYVCYNRRFMYAALNWCQEHYVEIVDAVRTLLGGSVLQMPASADILDDEKMRETFENWFSTPTTSALDRYKLFKLSWDVVGSEFAGRHMLYEKFYAGNSMVVRSHSDREAPWDHFHATVDRLLKDVH
jgi:4-hydroxyphenylacetate 3-monooxygenase